MPDLAALLADVQRAQRAHARTHETLSVAMEALASALQTKPTTIAVQGNSADDEKLLAMIAAKPRISWRVHRRAFGGAGRADQARERLLTAGRIAYENAPVRERNNRVIYREVLVVVEREKAPEGAPRPRILDQLYQTSSTSDPLK